MNINAWIHVAFRCFLTVCVEHLGFRYSYFWHRFQCIPYILKSVGCRKFILFYFSSFNLHLQSSCSSVFRELRKYQKDCSSWCGECQCEKKERQRQAVAATKMVLYKYNLKQQKFKRLFVVYINF